MSQFVYKSESTTNIDKAILKIRKKYPEFIKAGGTCKADGRFACVKLEVIIDEIEPLCNAENILLEMHTEEVDNQDVWLYASLTDLESAEFRASAAYLFPKTFLNSNTQQDAGKIITYQARNLLRIFLSIISVEPDYDDGKNTKTYEKPKFEQKAGCLDQECAKYIYDFYKGNNTLKDKFFDQFKNQLGYVIKTSYDIKEVDYDAAADMIEALAQSYK